MEFQVRGILLPGEFFFMKLLLCASLFAGGTAFAGPEVRVEAVPDHGIQPETAAEPDGTVHLVYLQGEPGDSSVRYCQRKEGQDWSAAIPVSLKHKGVAAGTIRGPQIAVDPKGAVHVIWHGAAQDPAGQTPLWYAGKTAGSTEFSEARNLMGGSTSLDGGASISVNNSGRIYVVWHGNKAGEKIEESRRYVFVSSSGDGGLTFLPPEVANPESPGVCACCSLRTFSSSDGPPIVLFRNAGSPDTRSMTLLGSKDHRWNATDLEPWKIASCPMSSASLARVSDRLLGAWETEGRIRMGWVQPAAEFQTVASKKAKHPVLIAAPSGNLVVCWIEGSGWNQGGTLHWQKFGRDLQPLGEIQSGGATPVWGKATGYAETNGTFVILR